MCAVFARYKEALYTALKAAAKAKDLGRAKALLEKHGISITIPQ
jgi:molybdopterin-guanine dinucleotide biosynthesis protein A